MGFHENSSSNLKYCFTKKTLGLLRDKNSFDKPKGGNNKSIQKQLFDVLWLAHRWCHSSHPERPVRSFEQFYWPVLTRAFFKNNSKTWWMSLTGSLHLNKDTKRSPGCHIGLNTRIAYCLCLFPLWWKLPLGNHLQIAVGTGAAWGNEDLHMCGGIFRLCLQTFTTK